MATVLTPASMRNAVSSARPSRVVGNRLLATSTSPVGVISPRAGDHSVAVDVEAAHLAPDLLHVHLLVVGGHRERTTV